MSLSKDEMARLILSVGKGGSGGYRPLTPLQAAVLMERWLSDGASLADVASRLNVTDSIVTRFLSLLKLTDTVKSLVEFNASSTSLSFSLAHQISRVQEPSSQDELARAALAYGLSADMVKQVVQRFLRSGDSIEASVRSILALRPTVVRRHIIIGEITSPTVREAVATVRSQEKRDAWGTLVLCKLLATTASASIRITPDRFTISGDDSLFEQVSKLKPDFESAINVALTSSVDEL